MLKKSSQSIIIDNAEIILTDKVMDKAWLLIENNKIKSFGQGTKPKILNALRINAQGCYLSPGFIDLHIHGQIDKISNLQVKTGTTGFLMTLHAGDFNCFEKKIKQLKQINLLGAACLGFNLEGPFINKDMAGAQPKHFIQAPDIPGMQALLKQTNNDIKIITFACELKGTDKFIKLLKKHAVVPALGHSNATYEQSLKAIYLGASHATHCFNRMSGISARNPGLSTQVLVNNNLSAEIIADGHHVHPALLKLLVKNKLLEKIVLVTDSVAAMDKRTLKIISGVYRMEDPALNRACSGAGYIIAGSKLTMLQAVKNMVYLTDVKLLSAVQMASANPAGVIGLAQRKGKIANGYDADLVIFDQKFKCWATIVDGQVVFNKLL
ncbi:MAG: N-acetylglucosamine-6-phosphate deacetylase [Candidatus Omnitrophica bacterium]|nr:N-acetylglucosamine-6-phosphate deacetylase [Candidatus Omnitrophota bacterium]